MKTYTVKEIAELLDTNPETVRRWIRDGKLQAVTNSKKEGENKVILEGALNAFLKTFPKYAATLAAPFTLGVGATGSIYKAGELLHRRIRYKEENYVY